MALLRIIAIYTIYTFASLLVTCSTVFGWVPHVEPTRTKLKSRFDQNAVRSLSAHESGNAATAKATANINDITTTSSWDDQVVCWVDGILEQKSEQTPFVSESPLEANEGIVSYEWITVPDHSNIATNSKEATSKRNLALRTTGEPLLDADSIAQLRRAAESLWERQKSSATSSSRFTLQYKDTNSECHLDELIASDTSGDLRKIIDDLLTQKVYPLVRSAFDKDNRYGLTDGSLCVYDSLVVRYNGDKASDRFGASQPLHGDGGVVSVNIALNSHRDETEEAFSDTFAGGGTFFEDLIECDKEDYNPILRPFSTGHALAHWSTHRHAGAPTRSGTRDILVFFLSQKRAPQQHDFNGIERSFQLKLKARELPNDQRDMALRCLDLAIENCPFDAQAHFWKGFNLIQGAAEEDQQRWEELCQGIYHLEMAKNFAPFDAKVNCYAGMAYRRRWMFAQQPNDYEPVENDIVKATDCLERALSLYENYCKHGISSDFDDNANAAKITLGEVYLQQQRFDTAFEYLTSILKETTLSEAMKQHISKLIVHSREGLEEQSEKIASHR